ncbi:MAG: hypothetical protein A2017_18755 [Lentisphaerae bacterium GWF2_44_16]|nr:MAG: hypothetical protein A2017_18755 [Lentisphaerae bacterium GWF2_44_16]
MSEKDKSGKKKREKKEEKPLQEDNIAENDPEEVEEDSEIRAVEGKKGSNMFLRRLMDMNFVEYASYVIKERAIPDVDDGFKPVQRRILWSLHRMDDGKFHKVANVIGHSMQYHPHGDASIGDALVVLSNKEYFIEKQGNFGNIFTGDGASAARYIECRLSPLAREVLFNSDITEFTDSYDGRNKEPVRLPCKVPSLLMLGTEGIAVGMATRIVPHNFTELLQAQIAILKNESFEIYPDFLQGGTMDVSEYNEGNGKVTLRAKIEIDGRRLIIREIPAFTTTESLIASIEKAVEKNKIKVAAINDYTGENVEIEITPMRGYEPQKALSALYAYTDCSISVTVNMMVICENRPVQMCVSEVIKRNTEKLLEYLRRELEIEQGKLNEKLHEKTLAQIFIENRIYKRIEKCKTYELVMSEVRKGLEEFKHMFIRDLLDDDIEKLLAIQIRRISLFDMNKNKLDIDDILAQLEQVQKNLKRLKAYAIKYLNELIEKYGKMFPRRTEIETFHKIDRHAIALNNIKVGWDKKNCYIGTSIRSEDQVTCNEFDHLLCVERSGNYKVINIPEKVYIGKLYEFRKYDKSTEFGVVYSETKSGKWYMKRCVIDKFITDKEYRLCPEGCRLELITPRPRSIYRCEVDTKYKDKKVFELNLSEAPDRSPKARGLLVSSKKLINITFIRLIDGETPPDGENGNPPQNGNENPPPQGEAPETVENKNIENQEEISEKTPKQKKPSKSDTKSQHPALIPGTDEETEKTPSEKSKGKKPEQKIKAPKKSSGEEEDFGITQPEFGF